MVLLPVGIHEHGKDNYSMIDYGLKDRVVLITGANNPQGIGAATALAFAREGAKVVLVYKKIPRSFDETKTDRNGADRYFQANAGSAVVVERKLRERQADYLIIESDITSEDAVFAGHTHCPYTTEIDGIAFYTGTAVGNCLHGARPGFNVVRVKKKGVEVELTVEPFV